MATREVEAGKCPFTGHGRTAPSGTMDLSDQSTSYATFEQLREKGPVVNLKFTGIDPATSDNQFRDFLTKENLFVAQYDEVVKALMDARFSSDPYATLTEEQIAKLPKTPEELRPLSKSLLSVDPPDHTRLRKLVQSAFSVRAMEALRPRIQALAESLLDQAERAATERGEAPGERRMDLIADFAYPLPTNVISDMLGIPQEDRARIRGYTERLFGGRRNRGIDEEGRKRLRELTEYFKELFEVKRAAPDDELISQLVRAEEDGEKLDEEELLSMVFILYAAGHVTTVNLIGNGVYALLSNPDQLARMKAEPALVKNAVEETLRYYGPVDFISRRTATEHVDLGGTCVDAGRSAVMGLASANRDPQRFPDPDRFDVARPDADRHVAFGKGLHVCLGAPLARMEGQIAFETLFRRYPALRSGVPIEELKWSNSFLRGFSELPIQF